MPTFILFYFKSTIAVAALMQFLSLPASAAQLPATIRVVKPSVVAIGTYQRTRSPALQFNATGFVVGDGLSILSNAHSIPAVLDSENMETLGIVVGQGTEFSFRPAKVVAIDREHDLVHLRVQGEPMPALALGDSNQMTEGMDLAFTGFPLGMVLGLHHASHRATVAAIAPVVMPSLSSRKLNANALAQLQRAAFSVFQLDATAYPGNSGSPLYDPNTGTVYGIMNMVFVKGLKETAISAPSGISYAIPSNFARDLLQP